MGKEISFSCRLAITVLRPHPGMGAGHLCQLKLENAAVDAIAFQQELCNGVVEQFDDRMLLDTCALQSAFLIPWNSQGRCGRSVVATICSSVAGTGRATGASAAGRIIVVIGEGTGARPLLDPVRAMGT